MPIPGQHYKLEDVAEAVADSMKLWSGYHSTDLSDEGVVVEAETVEQSGRPVVLVRIGAHLYALPVYRLTRRESLPDFT